MIVAEMHVFTRELIIYTRNCADFGHEDKKTRPNSHKRAGNHKGGLAVGKNVTLRAVKDVPLCTHSSISTLASGLKSALKSRTEFHPGEKGVCLMPWLGFPPGNREGNHI